MPNPYKLKAGHGIQSSSWDARCRHVILSISIAAVLTIKKKKSETKMTTSVLK